MKGKVLLPESSYERKNFWKTHSF